MKQLHHGLRLSFLQFPPLQFLRDVLGESTAGQSLGKTASRPPPRPKLYTALAALLFAVRQFQMPLRMGDLTLPGRVSKRATLPPETEHPAGRGIPPYFPKGGRSLRDSEKPLRKTLHRKVSALVTGTTIPTPPRRCRRKDRPPCNRSGEASRFYVFCNGIHQ